MGATSGALSYRRYFVKGELPSEPLQTLTRAVAKFAFRDIDPESEEDRALGWASAESILNTEIEQTDLFQGPYLLVTLRVETLRPPASLVRAHLIEETRQRLASTGRERMPRAERKALLEEIQVRLKRQMLPTIRGYDMVWHLDSGLMRFWSHSPKLNEEFLELFEDTFGMQAVPETPFTTAERLGLNEESLEQLTFLEPEPMSPYAVEKGSQG